MNNCLIPFMNLETKVTQNSFIEADIPVNLVEHNFIVVIHRRSINIGIFNTKYRDITSFIQILANVFYALYRTAELDIKMVIECFSQQRRIWHNPTIVNVNVYVFEIFCKLLSDNFKR